MDSITFQKRHGHSLDLYKRILRSYNVLSPLDIIPLEKYYLIYWDSSYLKEQIKDGRLMHQGISYEVSYGPNVRNTIATLKEPQQITLSFRKMKSSDTAIVYISLGHRYSK